MNRREALSTLSRGAALGALAGTAVVAVSCQPVEAPAAEVDPMLQHIDRCRAIVRRIDAMSNYTDDEIDAACAPLHELYDELRDSTPAVTTEAGAMGALRFCEWVSRDTHEEFVGPVLGAVLAYFDGRAA